MSSRRRIPSAKAIAAAGSSSSSGKQKQRRSKKTKKPKYLSLNQTLSSLKKQTLTSAAVESKPTKKEKKVKTRMDSPAEETHQQLNLFPLYPEAETPNAGGGDEIQAVGGDDHVAILLETDAADTSTSLHGLLDSNTTTTTTTTSEEDPISPNYSIFRGFGEAAPFDQWLVRAAMRSRERDASEERWVSYCEVVEESKPMMMKKKKVTTKKKRFEQDEVNSGGGDFLVPAGFVAAEEPADFDPLGVVLMEQRRESDGLSAVVGLKLDYQEILDAWSDKGSLYVDGGESPPQTVPDLHETSPPLSNGSMECCGNVGNLWRVPEMGSMEMEENGGEKEWKLGQREASVLRYKEKRQNRLFSKRIRYEVRKLNAEKRPRLKGRFVKRIGE